MSEAPANPPADSTTVAPADAPADAASTAPPAAKPGKKAGGAPSRSSKGAGRSGVKSARRLARELALQGLYQWLLAGGEQQHIEELLREQEGFPRADRVMLDTLLAGCISGATALDGVIARHVDRPTRQLSPVEHGVLMIGCFELMHSLEVPYRVVINEAVELAKSFGGTDGHKYVNGVLDKAAADLRPIEIQADTKRRGV